MNKRVLIILLPLILAFGTVIAIYFSLKPKMQTWILSQISRLSDEKLPVNLTIKSVDWTLLFPELILEGISVSPKPGELQELPPIEIKKISASLDLLAIFAGRIAISSLLIENPTAVVNVDPYLKNSGPAEPLPLDQLFEYLPKIPVSRLGLKGANISILSEKQGFKVLLKTADILILNKKNRLGLQFDFNESSLQLNKTPQIPFRVQGEATLSPETLDLSNIKLGLLNSLLTIHGSLTDVSRIHMSPEGTLEYELFSDLAQTSLIAKDYFKAPDLHGSIRSSGRLEVNSKGQMIAGFKMLGQKIKIDQFDVGDVQFEAKFSDNILKISDIELTNEAGLIDVKNVQVELTEKDSKHIVSLRGQIKTEQVDINELLIRLGVGDIPIEAFLGADLQCQGPLYPELQMNCEGTANAEQFEVRSGNKVEDLIVSVDNFGAQGDLSITKNAVSYKAKVSVKEDQGSSDGVISFKEGFKINFATPDLQFKNIAHLAGLKLEGHGSLQGSTQGDSSAATFEMNLNPKDFYFENFFLGEAAGNMQYNRGVMHFSKVQGKINSTNYQTDVTVDLNKKRIAATGTLPQYELADVFTIFERIYKMPVEITGMGQAQLKVEGPFQLGKLSYDIDTTLFRGMAVGESFDRAEFHLISESGEMKIQKAKVTKNKSEMNMTGISHPDGKIDLLVIGQKFPLEESENVSRLGAQISGLVDVNVTLKGPILAAETLVKGRIYQLNVEEQDFPDSVFELNVDSKTMTGKTDLFAGQLKSDFVIPLNETSPFKLDVKAKDWNYTTLFTLIGGGSLLNEYGATMTGDLQLNSDHGGLWASTGRGNIQNILLQRGSLNLKNKLPMLLEMKSGQISLSNFRLEGDETFFDLKGKDFSRDNMKLRVDGKANLRLFQIFVPFLEELAGNATLSIDTSGSLSKPEILGNAKINGGFVKIKGFPHPLEKMKADVQFSQSKILIEGLQGQLAGGSFMGDGSVSIEGPKNFPTNIKAHLENVSFNVPDRIRTSGNADMTFSGSWFPFTLSGTYHVYGGFMDKEFGGGSDVENLKASSYLPKMILQSAFEPILLDLNIILEKPLQLKNSLVDGYASGNLTVRGAPTQPILTGRVQLEKGSKITVQDKAFEVQAATIQFTGSADINPDIYLTAKSRITEYDVNILAQGSAKNPTLRFSSVPPLSEKDIISLMAFGVASTSQERRIESSQSKSNSSDKNLAAVVGSALAQTPGLKDIQDKTGVQVQVTSSYDDTRNVSMQKITLSKKLSDRVKATATQVAGAKSAKEYSIQYNLTDNVSAIGRYEDRQPSENPAAIDSAARESQSIFGIDLEFKKEFK